MRGTIFGRYFFAVALFSAGAAVSGVACTEDVGPAPPPTDSGGSESDVDDDNPVCGNKVKERIEQCDDGNSVNGDGCENDCTFTCKPVSEGGNPAKCDDGNPCNGTESCTAEHTCAKGTALADGAPCGTGKVCRASLCIDASCGDGLKVSPEECDDANVTDGDGCDTCRFSCVSTESARDCSTAGPGICVTGGKCNDTAHICEGGTPVADGTPCGSGRTCKGGSCEAPTSLTCGNGTREAGEQCDDGSLGNLDGCDAKCRFEQAHRLVTINMQWTTDTYCTANALGGAIGGAAQATIQSSLDASIKAGGTSVLFKFLDLDDLTGTVDPSIKLGPVGGSPVSGAGYSGTSDLDWWYKVDPTSIDSTRTPTAQLNGKIVSKVLDASGNMKVSLSFGSGPVQLSLSSVRVRATLGAATKPTIASSSKPPGHFTFENVDPALTSFATSTNGLLCGLVSAESLASVPAPDAVLAGGTTACSEGYTKSNSLLDVLVGGCKVALLLVAVKPTQPDASDAGAAAVGAGAPYTLTLAGNSVTGCKDKSGATADLKKCLASAAYSAYFKFTSDRVIIQ